MAPLVQETNRPRDGEAVVVPINENIPPPTQPAVAESSSEPAPVRERRHGDRWFTAVCVLLALLGAAISLAAPGLQPRLVASADAWLGRDNAVSRLLMPVRPPMLEEAMQGVNAQLAEYGARLNRLAATQEAISADIGRTVADLRADHRTTESLSRAIDDLSQQTRQLRATTSAVDAKVGAAGLLTLTMRLRRDLDAGLPLDRDLAALAVGGPYPPAIDAALQQLRGVRDGAPTMHDLAEEFDRVIAALAASSEAGASWASRNWTRVAALFGGSAPTGSSRLIQHLRALAADGRFTEAANEIMESEAADLGMAWAARVRTRATAVLATQSLLTYSLAAYESAFAATSAR